MTEFVQPQQQNLVVGTLNFGGINASPFEFYSNSTANKSSPIELFSAKMKENIISYTMATNSTLHNTLKGSKSNVNYFDKNNKTNPSNVKKSLKSRFANQLKANITSMKAISPALTQVWYLAKELDGKMGTNNAKRYSVCYDNKLVDLSTINRSVNNGVMSFNTFRNNWINKFLDTSNANNNNYGHKIESMNIQGVPNGADKVKAVMGLITYDYLVYKSLIESNISQSDYLQIVSGGITVDMKNSYINDNILASNNYDVLCLQEVVDGFNLTATGYTMLPISGEVNGSIIIVKSSLSDGFTQIDTFNSVRGAGKEDEIRAYQKNNLILVSGHLNSSSKVSDIELGRLKSVIDTLVLENNQVIVGIDANNEETPSKMSGLNITNITASNGKVLPTSFKMRTWIQTQFNKADVLAKKTIDHIISNNPLSNSEIVKSNTLATPNANWPFDHYLVKSTVDVTMSGAGKKKRTTKAKKRATIKKRYTTTKGKKRTTTTKGKKRTTTRSKSKKRSA